MTKSTRLSGLTRDGTAEPVPRNQFLRRERDRENSVFFPCYPTMSRNGSHTWSIYTLLRVLTIHTYSHLSMAPHPIFCNNIGKVERRLHFPGGGDVVCSPRVLRVRYDQKLSRLIWLSLGTRKYFDTNVCLQQWMQYRDNSHLYESESYRSLIR